MQKNSISPGINSFSVKRIYRNFISTPEVGVLIPLLLLILIIGIFQPVFFSTTNIATICRKTAFYGIVAVGVSLVIIAGSIDISVGSVAGMGACLAALLMQAKVNSIISIFIALAFTGLIGLFNGYLVAKLKMNGFIVTIGTMYIGRGISYVLTQGYPISPIAPEIATFGASEPFGTSWSFFIFIGLIIIFAVIMHKSTYGRKIYAVGDNSEVASLAGINVDWVKMSTFIITGILAGFAGILQASQLNTGAPQIGEGWELQVVAATAVGGISLLGGSGSMVGTMLGIFTLAVLTDGLIILKINPQVQTIVIGVVMIAAVMTDMIRRGRMLRAD